MQTDAIPMTKSISNLMLPESHTPLPLNSSTTDVSRQLSRIQSNVTWEENFYETTRLITGLYLFPVFCVAGIIGNMLAFIVFVRAKQKSSTNIYLTTLALSDTFKLLCDFLYFITVLLEYIGKSDASDTVFGTLYPYAHYILNFSVCNTAWLTVSVAIERYIYMKWPERAVTMCTITRAKITCCVVWLSSMLIAVPFVLRYQKTTENFNGTLSVTDLWSDKNFTTPFVLFQNIIRSLVPLMVLVIVNGWIIKELWKMSRRGYRRPLDCKNRVTIMLVAIIIAFLVCVTPDAIISLKNFGYADATYLVRGIREITDLLLCLNSAINFFLYFGFNKVFRDNFKQVFCKRPPYEHVSIKEDGVT
ncbi:hypothetical protein EB796_022555 [Bugula neritina]|uniref:G-protein coupled receptors family 1 profile domain-containing protein n=1 Tax=Bugula neritina TaxID=10212 RepID=A0A7J7J114_BUGNE|nr:hypothetical protein EB796_022555 [Bugula neritina]